MKDGDRRRREPGKAAPPDGEHGKAQKGPPRQPRSIELTLSARPLSLPGEEPSASSSVPAPLSSTGTEAAHFDAWTLDRLRRSSLPPAVAKRAVTSLPAPPRPLTLEPNDASEDGGALSLVGRAPVPPTFVDDLFSEMSDRFALGDFTGSLRAAELLLGQDPSHDLAQHYRSSSRSKLEAMYTSRLSAGGPVPELAVPESELRWLGLDPQIGMVLSRVDGESDIEAVIAGSTVPRLEALRALVALLDARVIRLV